MKHLRIFLTGILLGWIGLTEASVRVPADTAHFYMKHSYDMIKYQASLNLYQNHITPYPKDFSGKITLTFRVDSTLNAIKLNAVNSSLEVDSVRLAGTSFVHMADTLKVTLNRTYQPGEMVSVRVCYRHKNIADQAFYTSSGYVFTDFPPEGARKVFPCWDRPSDKALWELDLKVPLTARTGSVGSLTDSVISGDTIRYHWKSIHPVATYLVTISSRVNYLIRKSHWYPQQSPGDSIPVWLYYKAGENLAIAVNSITPITDFFSSKFGTYPFEKIGFATLNSTFPWGGMENQTMVNLMPGGYSDQNLIAHEHAHQWFGDLVTCGTWADVWLNEGFATYCQKLWVEENSGYNAYKASMNGIANNYLSQNPGIPLYNSSWAIQTPSPNLLYSTPLTYNKGACVLFQLRYVVGDSIFFTLMHDYATDTNFMFKAAVTEDFVNKANQVSGQDLDWFFNQWVYAPNHPVYENSYTITDMGNGTWKVNLTMLQTQTNTIFFKMPVEISVAFTGGADSLITVMNDSNNQQFEFTFTDQPTGLSFDPRRMILLKQATTVVGINSGASSVPSFYLRQNQPNPFSHATQICYGVGKPCFVKLMLYDNKGELLSTLINKIQEAGEYRFTLEADALVSGLYLLVMDTPGRRDQVKLVVAK